MALPFTLTFTQDTDDFAIGTVENTTIYGTGGNQDRNEAAEYLLWSKTNESGIRTFDNPDAGNVLSILEWGVNTPKDGYYEAILLRIQFYDAAANYVEQQESGGEITQYASIFYYATTGKVYKAIIPSVGQDPENVTYFSEVTNLSTLIGNTTIESFLKDIYTRPRASICGSKAMSRLNDTTCPNPGAKDRDKAYFIDGLIISADAEFEQGNPREMEKIIRLVEKKCASIN